MYLNKPDRRLKDPPLNAALSAWYLALPVLAKQVLSLLSLNKPDRRFKDPPVNAALSAWHLALRTIRGCNPQSHRPPALYEVEDIYDEDGRMTARCNCERCGGRNGKGQPLRYEVNWRGYSAEENSWEPRTHLLGRARASATSVSKMGQGEVQQRKKQVLCIEINLIVVSKTHRLTQRLASIVAYNKYKLLSATVL